MSVNGHEEAKTQELDEKVQAMFAELREITASNQTKMRLLVGSGRPLPFGLDDISGIYLRIEMLVRFITGDDPEGMVAFDLGVQRRIAQILGNHISG